MHLNWINALVLNSSSTGLFLLGTGALIGRNFIRGAGSKIGGIVANKLGANETPWNQSSEYYFKLAKKHTFRDLKLVAGLAALYAAAEMAKHMSSTIGLSEDLRKPFEVIDRKATLPLNDTEEMCRLNENIENVSCNHLIAQIANCTKLFEDYRSLKNDYFFLQLYAIGVAIASIFASCYHLRTSQR